MKLKGSGVGGADAGFEFAAEEEDGAVGEEGGGGAGAGAGGG